MGIRHACSFLMKALMQKGQPSLDRATFALAASIAGLALLLYYLTAARDIVVGDTPELITAAVTLGVPHPPGYPLFTILGHFFSLSRFGPIPFRVNLLSVLCGALTVGVVFLTAQRLCKNRVAAAAAALFLAISPVFWRWSLVAETFSLNNLLASLLIYFLGTWRDEPERRFALVAVFFVGGLACTNHQTIVFLAPAVFYVLWGQRAILWARPWVMVICLAVFALGLLPYAYVPWAAARHPAYNWGDVSSLRDLLKVIARRSYGTLHLVSVPAYSGGSPWARVVAFGASFGFVSGLLIPVGAIHACRKNRWFFWFTLLAFLGVGPFFISIANLNLATAPSALFVLERFFLLSHVVAAPLLACGVVMIAELVPYRLTMAGVAFIVLLGTVAMNYRSLDQSRNHVAHVFAEDVFASVEPGTILLASGDPVILPLIYQQVVERKRPDITLILIPLLRGDWYLRQLKERHRDLVIPFDHYDGDVHNLKMLVEANGGRPMAIIGPMPGDLSLDDGYWPMPRGLVNVIAPKTKEFSLPGLVSSNQLLFEHFRPPSPREIKAGSFESDLLADYAQPVYRIGKEYERAGDKESARNWYRRALVIAPGLPLAREALARLEP